MSGGSTGERATPERGEGPVRSVGFGSAAGRGPAALMGGMSTEKALDFGGSSRRLLKLLSPHRVLVGIALAFAIGSVTLAVLGPRMLGEAINVVFAGVAPGVTGHGAAGHGIPGHAVPSHAIANHAGVDFAHVAQILAVVLAMTVGSGICAAFQGRLTATMVQRAVFRLREDVEAKLARLPLSYFDRQPRG